MQYFKYGEVIIGSPSQIHKNLAEMLAKQEYDIGYFSRNKELQKRIENGSFRFYVTTGSYSKLYLLKAYASKCISLLFPDSFKSFHITSFMIDICMLIVRQLNSSLVELPESTVIFV